jgi:hypothetical protein
MLGPYHGVGCDRPLQGPSVEHDLRIANARWYVHPTRPLRAIFCQLAWLLFLSTSMAAYFCRLAWLLCFLSATSTVNAVLFVADLAVSLAVALLRARVCAAAHTTPLAVCPPPLLRDLMPSMRCLLSYTLRPSLHLVLLHLHAPHAYSKSAALIAVLRGLCHCTVHFLLHRCGRVPSGRSGGVAGRPSTGCSGNTGHRGQRG